MFGWLKRFLNIVSPSEKHLDKGNWDILLDDATEEPLKILSKVIYPHEFKMQIVIRNQSEDKLCDIHIRDSLPSCGYTIDSRSSVYIGDDIILGAKITRMSVPYGEFELSLGEKYYLKSKETLKINVRLTEVAE